ncbi:MAG: hypothetical protein D6767_03640 [Candidatus Hydrogenedentota bacterium]|nr:MAG: hypothetical protein D6767_03640 [Candidatus Hydrogenedentota bacterium]
MLESMAHSVMAFSSLHEATLFLAGFFLPFFITSLFFITLKPFTSLDAWTEFLLGSLARLFTLILLFSIIQSNSLESVLIFLGIITELIAHSIWKIYQLNKKELTKK